MPVYPGALCPQPEPRLAGSCEPAPPDTAALLLLGVGRNFALIQRMIVRRVTLADLAQVRLTLRGSLRMAGGAGLQILFLHVLHLAVARRRAEQKAGRYRSEEHTSELQSLRHLVC